MKNRKSTPLRLSISRAYRSALVIHLFCRLFGQDNEFGLPHMLLLFLCAIFLQDVNDCGSPQLLIQCSSSQYLSFNYHSPTLFYHPFTQPHCSYIPVLPLCPSCLHYVLRMSIFPSLLSSWCTLDISNVAFWEYKSTCVFFFCFRFPCYTHAPAMVFSASVYISAYASMFIRYTTR